jgi:phage terminase large subunit GpA-like protein
MLTAERLVTKKKKLMWELPAGRRNEALDCRVYSYAALNIIKPFFDQAVEAEKPMTMVAKKAKKRRNLSKGVK